MRILFLAHRVPFPPNKGEKIRAFHEIRGLRERGHEVHVLAFVDDPADLEHERALAAHCSSVTLIRLDRRAAAVRALMAVAGSSPWSLAYFNSARMRDAVARAAQSVAPQAWVTYSSPMTPYVPIDSRAHTLADFIDVDSEKWKAYAAASSPPSSWVYAAEARRLRAYEVSVAETFGATLLATAPEADLLRRDLTAPAASRLHALVNGVDADHFRPEATPGEARRALPPGERAFLAGGAPCVVFTGVMDYRPNVEGVLWFAREVWPRVTRDVPGARFLVVGSKPTAAVRALDGRAGITVTGFVADTWPYLAGSAACVAPLRIARGVQNKVLEAMACGRPVVATQAALTGLAATDGVDAIAADAPEDMAAALVSLIQDVARARAVGSAGRAFVGRDHSWTSMLNRFAALVEAVARPA